MQQRWALLVSDFRREYGISADDLSRMYGDEFRWLLQGLSSRSRFVTAWDRAPKHMHDPNDREAVKAMARR